MRIILKMKTEKGETESVVLKQRWLRGCYEEAGPECVCVLLGPPELFPQRHGATPSCLVGRRKTKGRGGVGRRGLTHSLHFFTFTEVSTSCSMCQSSVPERWCSACVATRLWFDSLWGEMSLQGGDLPAEVALALIGVTSRSQVTADWKWCGSFDLSICLRFTLNRSASAFQLKLSLKPRLPAPSVTTPAAVGASMWEISVSGQVVKQTAGVSEVKRGEPSPNPAKLRELSGPEQWPSSR